MDRLRSDAASSFRQACTSSSVREPMISFSASTLVSASAIFGLYFTEVFS